MHALRVFARHAPSLWLDFLSRDFPDQGGLARLVRDDAIAGVKSNPSIFGTAGAFRSHPPRRRPRLRGLRQSQRAAHQVAVGSTRGDPRHKPMANCLGFGRGFCTRPYKPARRPNTGVFLPITADPGVDPKIRRRMLASRSLRRRRLAVTFACWAPTAADRCVRIVPIM
jgi:hypothetical protein